MANIGVLSVSLTAKTDEYEAKMRRSRQASRDFGRDTAAAAQQASDAMERMSGKGGLGMEALSKGSRQAVTGILQLGDASGLARTGVGGLVGDLVKGFGQGGLIGVGLAAATGLMSLFGAESERAREKAAKAAEAHRVATEKAREAAERAAEQAAARAKSEGEYQDQLRREIDLLNTRSESERRYVENRQKLEAAQGKGGDQGAELERQRQLAEARRRLFDEDQKAADDAKKKSEAAAEKAAEDARRQAEAERAVRDQLRKQVEERLRLASLTEAQKSHATDLGLVEKARAAGLKQEADALAKQVEHMMKAEAAAKALTAAEKESAEAAKLATEAKKKLEEVAKSEEAAKAARTEYVEKLKESLALASAEDDKARQRVQRELELNEARKKGGEEAVAIVKATQAAEDKAAASKAAQDKASAAKEGSGEGPLARARQAKKDARRQRKNQRHADNLAAEDRERMGFRVEDGGTDLFTGRDGEGGFDYENRRAKKKKEAADAAAAANQWSFPHAQGGGPAGGGAAAGGGVAGDPTYKGPTDFRPTTTGGDSAPVDNRGATDAIKSLEDAVKAHEEATKRTAEGLTTTAEKAQAGTESATKAADGAEKLAEGLGTQADALDKLAQALTETKGADVAAMKAMADKLLAQAEELRRQKQQLDTIQKMMAGG